jgi:hypothetical protein
MLLDPMVELGRLCINLVMVADRGQTCSTFQCSKREPSRLFL